MCLYSRGKHRHKQILCLIYRRKYRHKNNGFC
uniref:Uncharacterized protein n=1 Tax=Siphoviridae sp. ctGdK3 TaxID=2826222 RepID=A0A8S5MVE8_9CAUD|nr:MAG TPA: hypothetical protein [Siphoviridae sp. ctGdK3]